MKAGREKGAELSGWGLAPNNFLLPGEGKERETVVYWADAEMDGE